MDEARQVFDVMISKGSMVNVRSCNTLINGYCKGKKVDKANEIFKEMRHMEFLPNTITYNTLIDGLCKAGRLQEAEKLFSEKLGFGHLPDVQTYAVLLDGLCNNQQLSTGLLGEAEKSLREMGGKGCSPNGWTYNTIIRELLNNKETSWAMELIQEMIQNYRLEFRLSLKKCMKKKGRLQQKIDKLDASNFGIEIQITLLEERVKAENEPIYDEPPINERSAHAVKSIDIGMAMNNDELRESIREINKNIEYMQLNSSAKLWRCCRHTFKKLF
ncbi:pentatricopeptide repeat-containing protein At1g62670, mitochondrial-like [Rosa rugosa]|uniref:pentatricopeptide repeat-containing protein At1g62670, mitochondrial-like n=1 Tax=Rosa rugosa TaxID=74645 RepID=UPI002B40CE19|nr:pentatricopeptide repeat-containing protein At1g62670, mitochondrial-like [Rosa rugosa]